MAAVLLVVMSLFGATGALGWLTSEQLGDLTKQLPIYKQTLETKIRTLQGMQSGPFTQIAQTAKELEKDLATSGPVLSTNGSNIQAQLGSSPSQPMAVQVVPPTNPLASVESIFGPLANVAVVAVFTIFMLVGREDLRNRFIKLVAPGRLNSMTKALDETMQRINRYLLLQLAVNAGYGATIGVGMYLIGVPNAPLWGVAATALRFLPYVGPPLAAIMPIVLSLAVFAGWWHALATLGIYVILEVTAANFVEPLVYGAHVGLSPLAILVAAVFWTLIWGFPGLLLSTPLTVCLVVIGRHTPSLSFLNVILGDEPVLTPHAQYYQRLLATDQNEAARVLEQHLREHSLEETYGSVLLPALSMAEQDRHRNELDDDTEAFIYQSTRELIEELALFEGEATKAESPSAPERGRFSSDIAVLCLSARDEADFLISLALCQLLDRAGLSSLSPESDSLSDVLSPSADSVPQIICISALPPFALLQARTLYKRARIRFPDLPILVCYWLFEGDREKLASRLKLDARCQLVTTIPQVLQSIRDLTDSPSERPESQQSDVAMPSSS
jgi:predicted PurR-regulated permease PerM